MFAADVVAEALQPAADARVAHVGFSCAMRTTSARMSLAGESVTSEMRPGTSISVRWVNVLVGRLCLSRLALYRNVWLKYLRSGFVRERTSRRIRRLA